MRYLSNMMLLVSLLALCGCTTERRTAEPSYSGNVEVVLPNGKVLASRDYAYSLHEVLASAREPNNFNIVGKGAAVATLRVQWHNFGMDLDKRLAKAGQQISDAMGKRVADRLGKETAARVEVKSSLSCTATFDYKLIKNGGRYSLCPPGLDDAEYFGFCADNDSGATDVAMDVVVHVIVPSAIRKYLDDARRDGIEVPSAGSDSGDVK